MKPKFNYIPIKLICNEDAPKNSNLFKRSDFFKYAFSIKRDHMVGCATDDLNRDSSLDIWKEISPRDGRYEFELAVQLPFFLPRHGDADEYAVTIGNMEYVVSNRHCEVFLDGKPDEYFLAHYLSREGLAEKLKTKLNQVIMAKSLVIAKFVAEAASASDAVEASFADWIAILNRDLPTLITAMRYHLDEDSYEVPECNDIGKFCPIYVLCQGTEIGKPLRFAAHVAACQIQPFCKFSCDISTIEAFCAGTTDIDMPKVLLDRATLLLRSGELSLACILACMACETFLTDCIRQELLGRGLTKSKEKDAFNDLTFSQMLNLLSYFLLDMTDQTTKTTVGRINALRKLRNDIVHNGRWLGVDSQQAVKDGIAALKGIRNKIGAQPEATPDGDSAAASSPPVS
ncbi:hypothetical protein [Desulfonatronum sp. SC1]|uniref:hypothetical protein n=1 Tax=Desulfonatronum sp. SC1 TaxID=2109626 RepID=UPI0011B2732F|nr:hypothetical protein [Desulfonatronum sp. SC1]